MGEESMEKIRGIRKMKKKDYIELYKRLKGLIPNQEIFPDKEDSFLEKFITISEDNHWMGIPSFNISSKEELTRKPHLSMGLKEKKIEADVFFNGKDTVELFCNILSRFSYCDKEKLIEALNKLDHNYSYELLQDTRVANSIATWKGFHFGVCNKLSRDEIEELLSKIKELKDWRDNEQKGLKKGYIATIAVALAHVEIDLENNNQIREAFSKLIEILRIVVNIKQKKEIRKLEKESNETLRILEEKLREMDTPTFKNKVELHMLNKKIPGDSDTYINKKKGEILKQIDELNSPQK